MMQRLFVGGGGRHPSRLLWAGAVWVVLTAAGCGGHDADTPSPAGPAAPAVTGQLAQQGRQNGAAARAAQQTRQEAAAAQYRIQHPR